MEQLLFRNAGFAVGVVIDRHDELGQGLVPCSFAEAVDRHMDPADARLDSGETVCRHESVIVVSVEIDPETGRGGVDPVQITGDLLRGQDSERIRQHHPFNLHSGQPPQEGEDIREGIRHPVGPVFEINIDPKAHFPGLFDLPADIGKMFFRFFSQLDPAVVFGSLGKQIEHGSSAFANPGGGFSSVDESENLHAVETVPVFRPLQDGAKPRHFPF